MGGQQGRASASVTVVPPSGDDATSSGEESFPPRILSSVLQHVSSDPTSTTWITDPGANISLIRDISLLHSLFLYEDPVPIALATTAKVGTIAIGSLLMYCQGRHLWVHGVHCDPNAAQNLPLRTLVRQVCSFVTNDQGEHVMFH